jgi:GNAT superfamily N-acetyltransferase
MKLPGVQNHSIIHASLHINNECAAIYAGGTFGEISELYVDSSQRSSGVGAKLIDAAKQFGIQKGWPEIEVGALPQPEWKRTSNYSAHQ